MIGGTRPYCDVLALSLPSSDIYCEEGVVRVETPKGMKLAFSFTERDAVDNSLWGRLTQMWKPLDGRQVSVAKLREIRRGMRF